MENKNTPKLRFKEFDDEWETKLFKEIISINRGLTYKPSDIVIDGVRVLRSSNIDEDTFKIFEDDVFVNEEVVKIPFVENGDILVTAANGSSRLVGKHAIVNNVKQKTVHGGFMLIVKSQNPNFVNSWMNSYEYKKTLQLVQGGNGAIGNLSKPILENTVMTIPVKTSEQSAIGMLFQTLDELLSAYKDNLANYQAFKATMLSKMFPKAGQTTPEIRLDGFEEEWKFVRLNDIAEKVKEKNKDNLYTETFTNSAEFGIVNQRDFFDKDISNEKNLNSYYVVQNDDFVYNPRISNFAPVGPIKRNKLGRTGVMSPLYFVFRIKENIIVSFDYLETVFNNRQWHKFMKLNGDSGARSDRFSIKDSVLMIMPIPFPSIDEQRAIGAFFSNLDDLIASQQVKIAELETLKKKLLQDMFV
ncbi:type I restriction enzyme S subunit [Streptococcus rupicaprae]|uniref:Type I restriction enzyme S subunit n=1 Tax=Streptococcus rupicaprae TaxID=759619 RepID=A0ABV2FES8_9STRE